MSYDRSGSISPSINLKNAETHLIESFKMITTEANDELDNNLKPSDILKKYKNRITNETPSVGSDTNINMTNLKHSMSVINIMSLSIGLVRAKHAFKKKLSEEPPKLEDIRNEGEKAWEAIEKTFLPSLTIDGLDFSDLAVLDNSKVSDAILNDNNNTREGIPPPAPPPPPANQSSISASSGLNVTEHKLVKLHWEPLQGVLTNTVWSNLPSVNVDKEELKHLFKIRERKMSYQGAFFKPKEISILDPKRSNQINIGIKSFPSASNLKTAILNMDDSNIKREGIEKLLSLIGTVEEISMIKEAQKKNPGIPLGHAEQFLLVLHSISSLDCRLKLWAFKMDFTAMEKDIMMPLKCLKESIRKIKLSKMFSLLLSFILDIGNFLNKSRSTGFNLDFLPKLVHVKDTEKKKSLLFHVCLKAMEAGFEANKLKDDFEHLELLCKTDYDKLKENLDCMEEDCKASLGFIKLANNYDKEMYQMVNQFLENAAHEILGMKQIFQMVCAEHTKLLEWFGIPLKYHSDYSPMIVAEILSDFLKHVQEVKQQMSNDRKDSAHLKEAFTPNLRRKLY